MLRCSPRTAGGLAGRQHRAAGRGVECNNWHPRAPPGPKRLGDRNRPSSSGLTRAARCWLVLYPSRRPTGIAPTRFGSAARVSKKFLGAVLLRRLQRFSSTAFSSLPGWRRCAGAIIHSPFCQQPARPDIWPCSDPQACSTSSSVALLGFVLLHHEHRPLEIP